MLKTVRDKSYMDTGQGVCRIPFDELMKIRQSSYSPGVQRAVSGIGTYISFEKAEKQIQELSGLRADAKAAERIIREAGEEVRQYNHGNDKRVPEENEKEIIYLCMDGTGIPMHQEALTGHKGKITEQAETREVKPGCIFTQTDVTAEGYPRSGRKDQQHTGEE